MAARVAGLRFAAAEQATEAAFPEGDGEPSSLRTLTDAAAKAYRVYYRKVDLGKGDYTMDHPGGIYIFDGKGGFAGLIYYKEKPEAVIAKLKRLVGA